MNERETGFGRDELISFVLFLARHHCGVPLNVGINVDTNVGQLTVVVCHLSQWNQKTVLDGGYAWKSSDAAWDMREFKGKTLKDQYLLVRTRVLLACEELAAKNFPPGLPKPESR